MRALALCLLLSGCASLGGPAQLAGRSFAQVPFSDAQVASYDARWLGVWERRYGPDSAARAVLGRLDTIWEETPGMDCARCATAEHPEFKHSAGFTDWPGSAFARARIRIAYLPGLAIERTARGHELVHLVLMAKGLDPQADHAGWSAPGGFYAFLAEVDR